MALTKVNLVRLVEIDAALEHREAFITAVERIRKIRPDIIAALECAFEGNMMATTLSLPFHHATRIVIAYAIVQMTEGALPSINADIFNEMSLGFFEQDSDDNGPDGVDCDTFWYACVRRMGPVDRPFMRFVSRTVKRLPDLTEADRVMVRFYVAFVMMALHLTCHADEQSVRACQILAQTSPEIRRGKAERSRRRSS